MADIKYLDKTGLGKIKSILDGLYSPISHSHTKGQIGLGNVDNTADKDKNVKYATSAGSANDSNLLDGKDSTYFDTAPYSTIRDFTLGTLIKTDINYNVTSGDPFYVEIKGNTYVSSGSMHIQIQGYIYNDTIINYSVTSLGVVYPSEIIAKNVGGYLCFWFPRIAYWHGYYIKVTTGYDYRINRVTEVLDSSEPSGTKRVILTNTFYTNYSNSNLVISGGGSIGGSALSIRANSNTYTLTIPTSLPASDVYSWAKASSKPTYTATEVGALPFFKIASGDANTLSQGLTTTTAAISNQKDSNHSVFLTITDIGTPFQLQIPDSNTNYIYKRYKSGSTWSEWSKLNAGYADTAGSAVDQTARNTANSKWTYNEDTIKGVKVNNASNADKLDNYHESDFFRYRGALYQKHNYDANTLGIGEYIFRSTDYGSVGTGANHINALSDNSTIQVFKCLQLSSVAWSDNMSYRLNWGGETNTQRPNGWSPWITLVSSSNYTDYVNTTIFPGLNKVGTVTSVTVTGSNGLSGSGTVTTSGTITLSNAGVRSTTINGNYLRINTNGTNADLTIPYATVASSVPWTGITDKPAFFTPTRYGTKSTHSYYKIKINSPTSWMLAFNVRIYRSYTFFDIRFSGYNYGTNYWYSPVASLTDGDSAITVYFGYDSAWNLWVGIPGGDYTGIEITNVCNGYTQVVSPDLSSLFTISEVSSLSGTIQSAQTIQPPSRVGHTHSNYLTGITKDMVTNALGYTPPITDTNTTYSAGTGLSLSSTTFSVNYGSTAGTACQGNDSRLSNSRPASDVYAWAKAATKPTYTASEVGAAPTNHGHDIEIGGRNYLQGYEEEWGGNYEYQAITITDFVKNHIGERFTISAEIKTPVAGTVSMYSLGRYGVGFSVTKTLEANKWTKIQGTGIFSDSGSDPNGNTCNLSWYGTYNTGRNVYVRNVKIERGNYATDYTPAIEEFSRTSHIHDGRYYTEAEIDTKLASKAASSHTHSYLPLSGGTLEKNSASILNINNTNSSTSSGSKYSGIRFSWNGSTVSGIHGKTGSETLWRSNASFGNAYEIFDTGNYTAWVPTKDGTGASGTWPINITGSSSSCTGNASSATKLSDNSAYTLFGQTFFNNGKPVNVGSNVPVTASYYNFRNNANTDSFGYIGRGGSSDLITFGTYGEQAINFMTNSNQRMSISGSGDITFNSNVLSIGKSRFISYPNGGTLNSDNGSETGYIKITLPQSWSSTMIQFYVDIYNYSSGEMSTYIIGGYNYNGGTTYGTNWVNTSAYSLGKGTRANLPVQFGHDGTKCCIYIGNANTSWNYPHISVHNVTLGHSNFDYSKWASGWNISFTTTLGTISGTTYESPNMRSGLASSSNYLSLNGGTMNNQNVVTNLNADLLDGYSGSAYSKKASAETFSGVKIFSVAPVFSVGFSSSGNVTVTGSVTASAGFFDTSDERLKDFYDDISIDFNKLKSIPKKYFSWKDDTNKEIHLGTSAQIIKEIYPEIVNDNEGTLTVDYSKLSVVALAAIDKLNEENTQLKDENTQLKNRLDNLEKLLKDKGII